MLSGTVCESLETYTYRKGNYCGKLNDDMYTNKKLILQKRPINLIYNYILPIIDYGIILWKYAPERKLIKIANIQKRSARMILDKSWDHPSNPLFNELNWLPLQSRITYHLAVLVF